MRSRGRVNDPLTAGLYGEIRKRPLGLVELLVLGDSLARAEREELLAPLADEELVAQYPSARGELLPSVFSTGEYHPIPSREGWGSNAPFHRFQERFKDRLRDRGLPSGPAHAIVGALAEMSSNADEHAGASATSVACFYVSTEGWGFGVGDLGRGIRRSLADNPKFTEVASDLDALQLAVTEGVSRTGEPGRGRGYSSMFKALADRQCRLRFRTGRAIGTWSGTSPTAQRLTLTASRVDRPGLWVCVEAPL